jgi:ubiquinone/menaquinone biosynthesis C-methylase UbiE
MSDRMADPNPTTAHAAGGEAQPATFRRDIFTNGDYVGHFRPDADENSFHRIYSAKRRDLIDSVSRRLPADGRLLDLAGGMGRMAVPLSQSLRVELVDISEEMLRLAADAAAASQVAPERLSLRRLDAARALPYPDGCFDGAIAIDLLVHLADPSPTLRELRRVLAPAGRLWIDTTSSTPWWLLAYPRYVGRRPSRWVLTWRSGGVLPEWRSIVRHRTRAQLHALLAEAGFDVVEEWAYGPAWCPKWHLACCRPAAI